MGVKTVKFIPNLLPNEKPSALEEVCFKVLDEEQKREDLLQKLFPKTSAARGRDYCGEENSLPAMLCSALKQILPMSGLTTREEIEESITDFLESHEEEARAQFQATVTTIIERETGRIPTDDDLKNIISKAEAEGRFDCEARRVLTNGNELQIFEDVQDTLQWAVCSVYASLEARDTYGKGLLCVVPKKLPTNWGRYIALLAQAKLIAEIDFPHCAKQKGGNRKLETRDEFSKTIPEAVRLAGGVEAWKRLTLTNQIRFLQDASEKYRAKGAVSFSTAKNWIERATEIGLFELIQNEENKQSCKSE